jgi:hypothetical protein
LGPPVAGALRATQSTTEGLVYTGALESIGPTTIGSTEDAPSPPASSPSSACRLAAKVSIFDASSSSLNNSTSV